MSLSSKNETSPEADRSEQPDKWSDLHPDLIDLISQKLTDIFDFVRFRVVCKRWRSVVQASDLPPQLPWITDNCGSFSKGYLRFYSLLTGKTHVIKVPQSSEKVVTGSACNYLLTCKRARCSLFNPLTNEELSLPKLDLDIWHPSCVPFGPSPDQSSRYVVISSPPIGEFTHLYFCQLGDEEWYELGPVIIANRRKMVKQFQNSGFTFYDGRCYARDRETGFTKVIDVETDTVLHVVPPPKSDLVGVFVYLVVSSGEILRVCKYEKNSSENNCDFYIYRLELGNRDRNVMDPYWLKIDNISNQFLFLHEIHGCAFRAEDFPEFLGNSI
ncbi:F-box protein skip23 [Rhynchospora pubera]|uniref:F-box protein skip23 n=1 Tax=Rhynchospora pubera TaxID=906938 RepID=A0AAV8GS69_9POAL|nr:F-box protein skip23 [Rhynchospora pubera]